MGCYINPPHCSKEQWLNDNAVQITQQEAMSLDLNGDLLPVCHVVNARMDFTAAAVAFSEAERQEFANPTDFRPKTWFAAEVEKFKQVSPLEHYLKRVR